MSTELDTRSFEELERRLTTACHAVIPRLLGEDEGIVVGAPRGRFDTPALTDVDVDVAGRPSHSAGRSRLVSIAAAVVLVAGGASVWFAGSRPDPSEANESPTVPSGVVATSILASPDSSVPCYDIACSALDRLPVVAGATDFYAGPETLGVPQVTLEFFDSLTRCAQLTSDFAACERIEGIAGVNLVTYASSIPVDTVNRSESSFMTNVGTTFTELTPAQYAAEWSVSGAGPSTLTPTVVRGHDAIRYEYGDAPFVVWQERPGVLVWVSTPPEAEADVLTIAEGVRRLDGPSSIPRRVMVAPLARVWDAGSNDGDGVLVASVGGAECVGLDYLEACGSGIVSQTVIRGTSAGPTTVAGSAPAEVAKVRISVTGAAPVDVATITFANYASRFYSTTVSGAVEAVTWLDDQGNQIASANISARPLDAG